ncbi:YjzD family protein [Loigolactobacillus iwatensis]|uniref:YjzD family protein n=1 Tax=Loigolactobacillus iwatensis TaxID=1267156 RepID=UPI000F7E91DE|nr:YjzD family protein [Loigolactobacillus iwatensis]
MKQIIVLIWALILGQLIGYIGSAVTSRPYSVGSMAVVSIIFAIILMFLPGLMSDKQTNHSNQ